MRTGKRSIPSAASDSVTRSIGSSATMVQPSLNSYVFRTNMLRCRISVATTFATDASVIQCAVTVCIGRRPFS